MGEEAAFCVVVPFPVWVPANEPSAGNIPGVWDDEWPSEAVGLGGASPLSLRIWDSPVSRIPGTTCPNAISAQRAV